MRRFIRFLDTIRILLRVKAVCRELNDQFADLPWEDGDRPSAFLSGFFAYTSHHPAFIDGLKFVSATIGDANVNWFSRELEEMSRLIDALIATDDGEQCTRLANSVYEFVSFDFEDIIADAARDVLGKSGQRIIEELLRADLSHEFLFENAGTPTRDSLNETQLRALDQIERHGPIKGTSLSRRLGFGEAHLRSRVLPALRPFGLYNDRSLGGYVIRLS